MKTYTVELTPEQIELIRGLLIFETERTAGRYPNRGRVCKESIVALSTAKENK